MTPNSRNSVPPDARLAPKARNSRSRKVTKTSVALRTTRLQAEPSLPSCVGHRRRRHTEVSPDGLVVAAQADLFHQGVDRDGPRRGPSTGPRLRLRPAAAPAGQAPPGIGRGGDVEE